MRNFPKQRARVVDALFAAGQPRFVTASYLPSALAEIKETFAATPYGGRLVTLRWRRFEVPSEFLTGIVRGLARASLDLWPAWAGGETASLSFREVAGRYCACGQLPLPTSYPHATLAHELARTLGASLAVLLVVEQDIPAGAGVIVRDAAGWLAANTGAAVTVLTSAVSAAELSRWTQVVPFHPIEQEPDPPEVDIVLPRGQPHPLSDGEKKLAGLLRQDSELGDLFALNAAIEGCHGNTYRADLLWREGGLVVEIDSYQTHGNRQSFGADRHRDYEMMASGCRVLRITNDEALSDTVGAIEKIRQIVRVIQSDSRREE